MNMMSYWKTAGVAALGAAMATLAIVTAAKAADITKTYSVTATDFVEFGDASALGPIQNYSASFTVTFDPSVFIDPTTQGLVSNYNTLPFAAAYGYQQNIDELAIATDVQATSDNSYIYTILNPNSFFLFVEGATQTNYPPSFELGYALNNGVGYYSTTGALTITDGAVSAAPEPSTWVLMIAGIGMIGGMMRYRARAALRAVAAT